MESEKIEVFLKLMKNNCYSIFNLDGDEIGKNYISKSEVYAECINKNYLLKNK